MNKNLYIAIGVMIVIVAVGFFLTTNKTILGGNNVAIQLTDPPQVPAETQALMIDYSSEQVHLSNAGNQSGWVSASGSGTVDLMSIINLSQTIGTVSLPADARIEMVRFNVTSATIRINGTTYNVTVPSRTVTAHITGGATVNGSSSILLDLAPTIATIVTENSTIYVMVPSLKAIIIPGGTNSTTASFGSRVRITERTKTEIEHTGANISITSASVSVAPDNVTHISITVKDNSNSSVILRHAGIYGNVTVHHNNTEVQTMINRYMANLSAKAQNSPYCANATRGMNESTSRHNEFNRTGAEHYYGGFMMHVNASICTPAGLAAFRQMLTQKLMNFTSHTQAELSRSRFLIFGITGSGTLVVPTNEEQFENSNITIQSGQSVTLHFDGVLQTKNGVFMGTLTPGAVYKVGVQGEEGAKVITSVTAATSSS